MKIAMPAAMVAAAAAVTDFVVDELQHCDPPESTPLERWAGVEFRSFNSKTANFRF